jgi:hypothetical protein
MDKDFIIREVTPEELADMRIAVKEIQYIETHDKQPTKWYKMYHRKGEQYRVFKLLPYPHFEKKTYEEDMIQGLSIFTEDELYTVEEMNKKGYIIENGEIYCKPFIILCYGPDKKLRIEYDSHAAMMRAWENLRYRFEKYGLHFIF